jgi:hypothetical protein
MPILLKAEKPPEIECSRDGGRLMIIDADGGHSCTVKSDKRMPYALHEEYVSTLQKLENYSYFRNASR